MEQHELTAGQEHGLSNILKFVDDSKAKCMLLEGYAGTGKTYLIQQGILALGRGFSAAFTAPTNKATKVLREMALESGTLVSHVSTIYSLLGLTLKPNGEVKAISRGAGSLADQFDIVVIDEASMNNSDLMGYIMDEMKYSQTKFIFMGDPLQLPPIGEELSKAFSIKSEYNVEVTEVVRTAKDNPINQLTVNIRESILAGRQTFKFETKKNAAGLGVYVLPKQKWEAWMRAGFCSEAYDQDGDAFRAVAWRNMTVNYLNRRIRNAKYGDQSKERFLVGERMINASPIQDEFHEEILAPIDSEGIIRDVEVCNHPYLQAMNLGDFKTYHLSLAYEDVGMIDAFVLHEDAERAYNKKLEQLSAEAKKMHSLWSTFWDFKDSFNDVRPAYAITSHRSQGSTYQNTFVDVQDILDNRNWEESMKSLYVACSRSSKNLMLLT